MILPQSLSKQPPEMHPLLMRVANLEEQPQNDDKDLKEAANICNDLIISRVAGLLVFAFHSSETLLASMERVKDDKIVTTFFLD